MKVDFHITKNLVGLGFALRQGEIGEVIQHVAVGIGQGELELVLVKIEVVVQLKVEQHLLVVPVGIGDQYDGFIYGGQTILIAKQTVGIRMGSHKDWCQGNQQQAVPPNQHHHILPSVPQPGFRPRDSATVPETTSGVLSSSGAGKAKGNRLTATTR